jgi:hypothetical protein
VRWMGGRVLGRQVEPLGDLAEGAANHAGEDLSVFSARSSDRSIHLRDRLRGQLEKPRAQK